MRNVYIIGVYTTQFKKWPEKSFKELTRDAYLGALSDAGMDNGWQIEFAYFGNCAMRLWGQDNLRGQVCFIPLVREGLFPERVPIINVEGACSTGSMAFHAAWKDILSGQSEVTLAIGVEKMFSMMIMGKFSNFLRMGSIPFDRGETIQVCKEAASKCGVKGLRSRHCM